MLSNAELAGKTEIDPTLLSRTTFLVLIGMREERCSDFYLETTRASPPVLSVPRNDHSACRRRLRRQ